MKKVYVFMVCLIILAVIGYGVVAGDESAKDAVPVENSGTVVPPQSAIAAEGEEWTYTSTFIGWGVADHYSQLIVRVEYTATTSQTLIETESGVRQTTIHEGTATVKTLLGRVLDEKSYKSTEYIADIGKDGGRFESHDGKDVYVVNTNRLGNVETYTSSWSIDGVYEYHLVVENGKVTAEKEDTHRSGGLFGLFG